VVVHHRRRRVGGTDELRPLGVQHFLLGLRVREERAGEEVHDPPDEQLSLTAVEARNLPCSLSDVLDVRVQLGVLAPERLCRTHANPPLLDS